MPLVKKQMIQGANTDLFNLLVPKAHNSERQDILFLLQIKPVKVIYLIDRFYFFGPSALMSNMSSRNAMVSVINGLYALEK